MRGDHRRGLPDVRLRACGARDRRGVLHQIEDALENPVDFKSLLQEQLARRSQLVAYRIEEETGPPHDRSFIAVAEVEGEEIGRGAGKTKKSAEQEAASTALEMFGEEA